jgi:carboxyl-terminal processing protease
LVNRYSASASEIFSGAIKDYHRGIVLGEPTFGKGTVQSVLDLNRYTRSKDLHLGQLKLTMAQFFRVNGDSTQHRGVVPDIIFPTAVKNNDQGERSLDNALPWAAIPAAQFRAYKVAADSLQDIVARHQQRLLEDNGFDFLVAQDADRREALDSTSVSLLKNARQLERKNKEDKRKQRMNSFRLSHGLSAEQDEDKLSDEEKKADNEKLSEELDLIELREAASILVDIIQQFKSGNKQLAGYGYQG